MTGGRLFQLERGVRVTWAPLGTANTPGAVPGRCSACGLAGRHRSRRALRGGARSRAEPAGSRSLRGGGVPEPSGARGAAPTVVTAPSSLAFRGGRGWQQRRQPPPERSGGSSPSPEGGPGPALSAGQPPPSPGACCCLSFTV